MVGESVHEWPGRPTGTYVSNHVYNLYVKPAKTANRAWKTLVAAYGNKSVHEADRLKKELSKLKFLPSSDPYKHVVAMDGTNLLAESMPIW